MGVIESVKEIKPEIPMVMISGHGDLETAINSMRLGAFDSASFSISSSMSVFRSDNLLLTGAD